MKNNYQKTCICQILFVCLFSKSERVKPLKTKIMKDLFNTKCKECKGGKYVETSMQDDWRGVLHCNNCNDEVKRYFKTSSKL